MPEIKEKVKSNVRERINAVSIVADNVSNAAGVFVDHLKKMEPVQAVCEAGKKAGDGTLEFIRKQAEITRRWVS